MFSHAACQLAEDGLKPLHAWHQPLVKHVTAVRWVRWRLSLLLALQITCIVWWASKLRDAFSIVPCMLLSNGSSERWSSSSCGTVFAGGVALTVRLTEDQKRRQE